MPQVGTLLLLRFALCFPEHSKAFGNQVSALMENCFKAVHPLIAQRAGGNGGMSRLCCGIGNAKIAKIAEIERQNLLPRICADDLGLNGIG
ncbi:MAG TPA: hypothetical protein VFB76_14795 [Candidatus Angelobacter sp.]|nr:hypothetical protein [Candidatus Angelobacter sp.]